MSVKERIIEFIKVKNLSHGAFEKRVGLSNGYVNNIRQSIQPDKLQKIALEYPDLNTGWLMTGEGEMLKNTERNDPNLSTIIEQQAAIIASQQRIIESLSKTIENLTNK